MSLMVACLAEDAQVAGAVRRADCQEIAYRSSSGKRRPLIALASIASPRATLTPVPCPAVKGHGSFPESGENTDEVWQLLDHDHTAGAIGYAVIAAADGDEAVVADAAFKLEHGIRPRCLT
jgi:hypothetical protein